MSLRNFTSAKRREFLETELRIKLSDLSDENLENDDRVHCENLIGAVRVPVGVAGPISVNKKERYIPLSTTEGALVASVNRGCKAILLSGGVQSVVVMHGQTRGPVFETGGVSEGIAFKKWVEGNTKSISDAASSVSSHISYLGAKVKVIGNMSYVRFSFDTKDAMGMNMVTLATEAIVALIEKKTKVKCLAVAGNFDIDKKPAYLNTIDGRGFEVLAECEIPEKVLRDVLHVTAQRVYDVWLAKCMIGSYASGSLGYNSHFANIIAAIFIATGQDPSHVVEGSMGITTCMVKGKSLYVSVNIPALLVGVVGGGTVLPTQRHALEIMGIKKTSKSVELAEIIGGAVVAGEISLLSAIATGTLGKAHKSLGRRKEK